MREGELRALRWGDVDWNSRRLWVRRSVDRRGRFKQLGHASVQITLHRYGHLMDQSYGDASARLETALFGESASVLPALPAHEDTTPFRLAEVAGAQTQ